MLYLKRALLVMLWALLVFATAWLNWHFQLGLALSYITGSLASLWGILIIMTQWE